MHFAPRKTTIYLEHFQYRPLRDDAVVCFATPTQGREQHNTSRVFESLAGLILVVYKRLLASTIRKESKE